jgi:hypothetical protein
MKEMKSCRQSVIWIGAMKRGEVIAMEGCWVASQCGIIVMSGVVSVCGCRLDKVKVVDGRHANTHSRCPFMDLRSYISEKGIRGPTAKDHYLVDGLVCEKEGHGGFVAEGMRAHASVGVAKGKWRLYPAGYT